jgi:membrane associated rhomboid family serine protease
MPSFSFQKICQWCVQHEAAQSEDGAEDVKQQVMPAPWVARRREASISLTQIIFGACVAVFLGMSLAAQDVPVMGGFPNELSLVWGANVGRYTLSGQWWRLLTYMFLH